MQKAIVTLTMDPSLDLSGDIETIQPEIHLECQDVQIFPGGGGINVSRGIQNLGGESTAFYVSGGYTGYQLEYFLNRLGLSHYPIPIGSEIRHSMAIIETATNAQYRFSLSRLKLNEAEVDACLEALFALKQAPDFLVLNSSLPMGAPSDLYARMNAHFKKFDTKVIVDVPTLRDLNPLLQQGFYMLKPNEEELDALAGERLNSLEQKLNFAKALCEKHNIEIILLSLGENGVFLISKNTCEHIQPPKVPVISKVGAGDSLIAGTVLALARDMSLIESVCFGVAASASAVSASGSGVCSKEDTEKLYQILRDNFQVKT